jgi:predicted SprT family Zn-dependent metalloprotease
LLALQLHNEINGNEAQQVLQIQRQRDTEEIDRAYSQLPVLGTQNANASPPWLSPTKSYPWQVVGRPAMATPTTSSVIQPTRLFASPGKIVKMAKPDKKKLLYASLQLKNSMDGNGAGPSNRVTPNKPVNLPPMQSIISSQQTSSAAQIFPEQTVRLLPKRTSLDDFHVQNLNAFMNLGASLDQWKILPQTEPNLAVLFRSISLRFFQYAPKMNHYQVFWNEDTFTDLTNFSITTVPDRRILLNRKTMLNCSRANLLSVLFHALIHCSVYESSAARNKDIYEHDANFTEIMKFFNEKLDLQIGTDHTFLLGSSENLVSYQCQGKCANIAPFYGIIKCPAQEALPSILSTSSHQVTCGGKFHKIFEISRTSNNNVEIHQIVHKVYDNPKVANMAEDSHACLTQNPRELVDITDDNEGPKVVEFTRVIDLDDEEFSDNKKKGTRKIVEKFKATPEKSFETCPICHSSLITFDNLRQHLGLCLGSTITWN